MALVDEINGSLLIRLSPAKSNSSSSTVAGKGLGASSDQGAVDVAKGLTLGSQAFVDSYVRMNGAFSASAVAESRLSSFKDLVSQMYDVASTAAEEGTPTEDRERLNIKLNDLIVQYQDILDQSSSSSTDVLDVTDFRSLMSDAGINLDAASELAQAVSDLGGTDGYLGTETVLNDAQVAVDPLSQDVLTLESARSAKAALGEFKNKIETDLSAMQTVNKELAGALKFATESAVAFSDAAQGQLNSNEVDDIAKSLVSQIRSATSDPMLSAHSNLDTELSRNLLGQ